MPFETTFPKKFCGFLPATRICRSGRDAPVTPEEASILMDVLAELSRLTTPA